MADTIINLSRDVVVSISSPKSKDQATRLPKQPSDLILEKSSAFKGLPEFNATTTAVDESDLSASKTAALVRVITDQQRLIVEVPDGDSAFEASLSACRRAQARFCRRVSHHGESSQR